MLEKLKDAFVPIIREIIEQIFKVVFDQMVEKNPVQGKAAIASLYPQIDVNLENLVDSTDTEYDDAAIEGIKVALEYVAEKHGIPLANVDND